MTKLDRAPQDFPRLNQVYHWQKSPSKGANFFSGFHIGAVQRGSCRCANCQNIRKTERAWGFFSSIFRGRNWSIMSRDTPHHWTSKGNKHWWIGTHADITGATAIFCQKHILDKLAGTARRYANHIAAQKVYRWFQNGFKKYFKWWSKNGPILLGPIIILGPITNIWPILRPIIGPLLILGPIPILSNAGTNINSGTNTNSAPIPRPIQFLDQILGPKSRVKSRA